MTHTVAVVACSASKLDPVDFGRNTLPARFLYTKSDLFKKAAAYAEQCCDDWVILSAKYGLVHPDDELPYYEQRLPRSGDRAWAARVNRGLRDWFGEDVHYVVLAPAAYRKHLFEPGSGLRYTAPLTGLGIGQQKAWLKQRLEER